MIRCLLTLSTILLLTWPASAAVVKSAGSGNWSDAKTWDGGKTPAAGDTVLVRAGHAVIYDVQSDAVVRALFIVGTLTFSPDKDTELNVGLIKIQHDETLDENGFDCNAHPADAKPKLVAGQPGFTAGCLCCDGKPALLVGTPELPIAAGKTAKIRLHYIDGMDKESCPAIVCCGGRMDFHGQPLSRTWVKLNATIPHPKSRRGKVDTTTITLSEEVKGWNVGDRVIVTSGATYATPVHFRGTFHPNPTDPKARKFAAITEERFIKAIDGLRVTLDRPLENEHLGEEPYRAEVANLSRNVIVESAKPDGIRGHTMFHRGSAGSISYAEFRHLGKKGILGKYSLHFHLCGDTMRGSSVIGASIWDSHNRWITIHGTQYLVVRDCIGYQSLGHGYFLEDGSEVYNVFDRNLAVQAFRAEMLPKQVLPFDKNEGAGFWWANSLNTFTRNVAVECDQYGFRFEATPTKQHDLMVSVRQPDGTKKRLDLRTLPFVRFEDNETHNNAFWGLNLGQHSGGKVGPAAENPFVIRNMRIWGNVGGFGVEVPNVLIDGMTVSRVTYAIRDSKYVAQDYRNVTMYAQLTPISTLEEYTSLKSANGTARTRQPGWPKGNGDGGVPLQGPEIEVAKLNPIDKLPPQTVITHVRAEGNHLVVRGTTTDDGQLNEVTVNGSKAKVSANGEWEVALIVVKKGPITLVAKGVDVAGNMEKTPHEITVVVRE